VSVTRGDGGKPGKGNGNEGDTVNDVWREVALCVWFVAVIAAYFLPCLGMNAPDLTAVYGLFLLVSVGALVLGLLRGSYGVAPDAPASDTILSNMVTTPQNHVPPTALAPADAAPLPAPERKPRRGR